MSELEKNIPSVQLEIAEPEILRKGADRPLKLMAGKAIDLSTYRLDANGERIEPTDIELLHDLTPALAELINQHYRVAKDWHPHDFIPWSEGRNFKFLGGEDWSPEQSRLDPVAQSAMTLNLLTEDNLPSYHREIAVKFGDHETWRHWVGRWTAEENRHGIALRDYLTVTRGVDPVMLESMRMEHMTNGYDAGEKTLPEMIAYVTFQELATRVSHRNTGKAAGDDIADQLLAQIAKDENNHMMLYRGLVTATFNRAPNRMMKAILKEIKGFKMPGAGMPDFQDMALDIALAGIYDPPKHLKQVVLPTLEYWKVFSRTDLSGEGELARDELAALMEKSKIGADRFDNRREERIITVAKRRARDS
ncbi:MAG: acyl-ACP desaturase [Candidatus Saccharimonadales bacterium]